MENKIDNSRMDRRGFLRSTAAAGAGMVLAQTVLGADPNTPAEKQPAAAAPAAAAIKGSELNVALLGAGEQGRNLMNICLKMGKDSGIRFKAVCDIWQYNQKKASQVLQKLGHQHNVYVDYQEMLDREKDLQAVIIATPDFWHSEHAAGCMKAGLHVYSERTMATTLDGAKKMVLTARETGRLLQIGLQRRSNIQYIHCQEKVLKEAKALGRMIAVNAQWNRPYKPDRGVLKQYPIEPAVLEKYGFKTAEQYRNWQWYKGLGGGPLFDFSYTQIDVISWLLGAVPKSVMASGGVDYYDRNTHQCYDNVIAVFEYEIDQKAVRASYQTLTANGNGRQYEVFMGDQGTLKISENGEVGIYPEPVAVKWDELVKKGYLKQIVRKEPAGESDAAVDVSESKEPEKFELPVKSNKSYYQTHLANFFDSIRGKAKLNCPPEVGYESLVALLKTNEAIETGTKIEFKPEDFKV